MRKQTIFRTLLAIAIAVPAFSSCNKVEEVAKKVIEDLISLGTDVTIVEPEVAGLSYPETYQVRSAEGGSVQAEIRDGTYLFGPPEMPATAQTRRISEAEWITPKGQGIEPYFHTVFYEEVSPAYQMMVLSFPALRFY